MIFLNKVKRAKITLKLKTTTTKLRFHKKNRKEKRKENDMVKKKFREKRKPKQMRDIDKNAKICPKTRGIERQTNTMRFVVQMTIGARHRFGFYLFTQYGCSQIHTHTQ